MHYLGFFFCTRQFIDDYNIYTAVGLWLNFGRSEKPTKFEKIFLMVCPNREEFFFKFYEILRKSILYLIQGLKKYVKKKNYIQ